MDLATILIVSNEGEFSEAITSAWLSEVNVPSFVVKTGSEDCRQERFELAIVGRVGDSAGEILEALCSAGKPIIHVSRLNSSPANIRTVVTLFEVPGWPEAVTSVANQMLGRELASASASKLSEQLEHQAALGRYIIEMRHNLNNALTSILGNCDLILLDENQVSAVRKGQVETIRNMAMRMNEIMQRLSSLQKEMQLVEQQNRLNSRVKRAEVGG